MPGFTELLSYYSCLSPLPAAVSPGKSPRLSFSNQLANLLSADCHSCHLFTNEHLLHTNIPSKHNLGNGETARWLRAYLSFVENQVPSWYPCQIVHNCLELQLRGICHPLLVSIHVHISPHRHRLRHNCLTNPSLRLSCPSSPTPKIYFRVERFPFEVPEKCFPRTSSASTSQVLGVQVWTTTSDFCGAEYQTQGFM